MSITWVEECWKLLTEDRISKYQMLLNIAPAARTAMDKKSGKALADYVKKLGKQLASALPWIKSQAGSNLAGLRGKVKSGEVVVMLDSGDSKSHPLYENAKISK